MARGIATDSGVAPGRKARTAIVNQRMRQHSACLLGVSHQARQPAKIITREIVSKCLDGCGTGYRGSTTAGPGELLLGMRLNHRSAMEVYVHRLRPIAANLAMTTRLAPSALTTPFSPHSLGERQHNGHTFRNAD